MPWPRRNIIKACTIIANFKINLCNIADYEALLWILAASQVAVVIILIGLVFTVMVIICMSWKR